MKTIAVAVLLFVISSASAVIRPLMIGDVIPEGAPQNHGGRAV